MSELQEATAMRGVDVAGPPDGKPVVCVHGVMFTRKLFAPQREALSDEFRVVVPDLPGHGARADERFRMEPALDVLERVVDEVAGGEAALVGLSLGGYVVTEFARRNPEAVDALVVSGASANPVGALETLTRGVSAVSNLATRSDLVRRGVSGLATRWVRSRDLPAQLEDEIVESGIYPSQMGEAGFELAGRDFRGALAAFPGPALLVNGRWDLINRLGEDEHVGAAQAGDLEVVAGSGHVVNLDRPAAFDSLVRQFVRIA